MYLWKLINTFHKKHPEKSIAISLPLDFALSMAKLLVLKEPKQKRSCLSKRANKKDRN